MKNRKNKKNIPSELALRPRVRIEWNTGTRVMLSKKDKSKLRRCLKAQLRSEMSKVL